MTEADVEEVRCQQERSGPSDTRLSRWANAIALIAGFFLLVFLPNLDASEIAALVLIGCVLFALVASVPRFTGRRRERSVSEETLAKRKRYAEFSSAKLDHHRRLRGYHAQRERQKELAEQARVRWEENRKGCVEVRMRRPRPHANEWANLSGLQFEQEVARLLEDGGHSVLLTPPSGDDGVDILLNGDTVVQCKNYSSPVGPAAVRELYGAMKAHRARRAILIARSSFTAGAEKFALNKTSIELWDLDDLPT